MNETKGRTSRRGPPLSLFGALWLASALVAVSAQASDRVVEELVAEARGRALAQTRAWLRLGHWREGLFGGFESQADGEAFFLHPQGRIDPAAELEQTLRAFFASAHEDDEDPGEDAAPAHPAACRFPARLLYLQRTLDLDDRLAAHPALRERIAVDCPGFRAFRDELRAEAVSLIFSAYYLNNPASAFGHTLLRIHKRKQGLAAQSDLLDAGIDFGANVDDDNALVYAVKGIVGLYPATFRQLTYAYKIRQYADYESRDLWAYRLALTPAQLEMLVAHLWELGSTYFDYYYFTENCSYHILGAIAAAVPEAGLLDRVRTPVIPADTVKTLEETPGLVADIAFRPSLRTTFHSRAARLDGEALDAIAELARDPAAALPEAWPEPRRIEVLDTAADLFDMRHARELIEQPGSPLANQKRALLARRADIPIPSPEHEVATPHEKAPHLGHPSGRFELGPSIDRDGDAAVAVGFRFSLHELADPSDGYPDFAQIEMGSVDLRIATGGKPRFILDDFSLVRIVSLNPLDRFVRLPSWRFHLGARTPTDGACGSCEVATVRYGAGATFAGFDDRLALFALADARIEAGHGLDGIEGEAVRAGLGPSGGLRVAFHRRVHLVGQGEWLWHPEQRPRSPWRAEALLRAALTRDYGFSLEGIAERGDRRGQLRFHVDF